MKDVTKEAQNFHETHKMKIGRDYRLEFLKLCKEDIYDFLETKYEDCIHEWRIKLQESEHREERLKNLLKELLPMAEDGYNGYIESGSCHQEFLSEDKELLSRVLAVVAV